MYSKIEIYKITISEIYSFNKADNDLMILNQVDGLNNAIMLDCECVNLDKNNISEIQEHKNIEVYFLSKSYKRFDSLLSKKRILLTEKKQNFRIPTFSKINLNLKKVVMKTGESYLVVAK